MNRRRNFQRGVVTIMAAGLIAFVAMAVTAMVWRLGHESSIRRGEQRAAQLRQLLLTGAAASPELIAEQKTSLVVPPPTGLLDRGASITLELLPIERDFERRIRVEAVIDGTAKSQTLRYVKGRERWGLVEASLDAPAQRDPLP